MRYLLLLTLIFAVACSHKPGKQSIDSAQYDQLVVVGTNDFHGYLRPVETDIQGHKVIVGGAELFAAYAKILHKKFGDHLVLLDGGDIFQGTLESNNFFGKPVIDFYNLLPYRAAAVGNHEFDYGPRKKGAKDRLGHLKDRMAEAKFPFVQANIFKNGKIWREKNLFPSVMIRAGAYKIGIIGLTTTTTPAKTLPQNVTSLEFRDYLEPTLREAKKLRGQGADFIFIATHEGEKPLNQLLEALPRGTIDAVVSGHSHTEVHEFVAGVPVIQSRSRGLYFGRIDLFVNKQTKKIVPELTKIHDMQWICGTWFKNSEECAQKEAKDAIAAGKVRAEDLFPLRKPIYEGVAVEPDQQVRAVLKPYFAKIETKKQEVLGQVQADFDWLPSGENYMGFLFLDASKYFFPYAQVTYQNGGGIRRRFFKGPLTYGDLYEVHPFDNYAVAVKISGKRFKDLVRVGISGANMVPLLKGINVYYFEDDSPKYLRDVNGDGKKDQWERDRLQKLVWEESGRTVSDEEEFWVATNDYLVAGGDNTAHVFADIPPNKRRYLDLTQRDVVAEYLRKHPRLPLPATGEKMRLHKVP